MIRIQTRRRMTVCLGLVAGFVALSATSSANHSWGNYHWARTSNPFTLKVGDNVSSAWDSYLDDAVAEWSQSSVLNLTKIAGGAKPRNCRPTSGRIEACSATYGNNGWLGLAQIWVSGTHITQATTKLNDTYFNTPTYNTPPWRRLVSCQEIAHDFGLDHQDETFDNPNLGTCMDYTNDPDGGAGGASPNDPSNEQPNAHDYQELEIIYQHLDSTTTVGMTTNKMPPAANEIALDGPGQWGRLVRSTNGGLTELYVQDFGHGHKVFTFVTWTLEHGGRSPADN